MAERPKRITRAVKPKDLADLLARPPRASLAFAGGGTLEAAPVAFRFDGGRYWVGLDADAAARVEDGRVALLVDEGCYHTELRGVSVRGRAVPGDGPTGQAAAGLTWLEVWPERVSAWNYGAMRLRGEK